MSFTGMVNTTRGEDFGLQTEVEEWISIETIKMKHDTVRRVSHRGLTSTNTAR
jgi:hypothetical protein